MAVDGVFHSAAVYVCLVFFVEIETLWHWLMQAGVFFLFATQHSQEKNMKTKIPSKTFLIKPNGMRELFQNLMFTAPRTLLQFRSARVVKWSKATQRYTFCLFTRPALSISFSDLPLLAPSLNFVERQQFLVCSKFLIEAINWPKPKSIFHFVSHNKDSLHATMRSTRSVSIAKYTPLGKIMPDKDATFEGNRSNCNCVKKCSLAWNQSELLLLHALVCA